MITKLSDTNRKYTCELCIYPPSVQDKVNLQNVNTDPPKSCIAHPEQKDHSSQTHTEVTDKHCQTSNRVTAENTTQTNNDPTQTFDKNSAHMVDSMKTSPAKNNKNQNNESPGIPQILAAFNVGLLESQLVQHMKNQAQDMDKLTKMVQSTQKSELNAMIKPVTYYRL